MATELIVPTAILASTNLDVTGGVAAIDEEIATWAPSDIASATLVGWFDADNVTLSGSEITQADDLSGNGNHATQTVSANRPTIASDARGNYMDIAVNKWLDVPNLFNGAQARSVFMYMAESADTDGGVFYSDGGTASGLPSGTQWRFRRIEPSGTLRIEIQGAGYTSAFDLGLGDTVRMIGCTFEGTTLADHVLWHNGSQEACTGTLAVNTANTSQKISLADVYFNDGFGQLREAIVCQGKISDTEIGQLLEYFQARWGVP